MKAGFEIVGDHPQAYEARKVFDYYKDLVTEIKLEAKVDGGDVVGHEQPFGVFVNLRHTREIERESGGFGRYLQNQNNTGILFYNFGRPLENYRDKFQDAAKQALEEHFEVMSVTFQDEKVNSRATDEYGWRVTPYAYLLLKARGPKVDKVPPLRLDLDFLDTSGYVVLPVESPADPDRRGAGQGRHPAVRKAPGHPDARRAAGQGRQADPRGQGRRPRAGARPGPDPRRSISRASRSTRSTIRGSRSRSSTRTAPATVIDSERHLAGHLSAPRPASRSRPRHSGSPRPRSKAPR